MNARAVFIFIRQCVCQVAKFPFEEVPTSKQGAKQELSAAAPPPAAAFNTDARTGKDDFLSTISLVF